MNWITGELNVIPAQFVLDLPLPDDAVLPGDDTVSLLGVARNCSCRVSSCSSD
jgi:hypothetical protein